MENPAVSLIRQALAEDLGDAGDLTSRYFLPAALQGRAVLVARESCVVSGIEVAAAVFQAVDPSLRVEIRTPSGTAVPPDSTGSVLLAVSGSIRSILTAERTALNFAQRLSGVASLTRRFVEAVQGTGCRILDTRKTTPGWRALEKQAVRHGGGSNHRMGLYDGVMIKDNHLAALGDLAGLQEAIDQLRAEHPAVPVEIEADTLDQVRSFLLLRGIDWILLDNMPPQVMREAVAAAAGSGVRLEASGGVRLDSVRAIAETGVDCISVGAITHSAPAADLALDVSAAPDGRPLP